MSRNTKIGVKVQLPKLLCTGMFYEKMELDLAGLDLFNGWNEEYKKHGKFPWTDNPANGTMRVRIDERTQVFDSKSDLIPGDFDVVNKIITCIVELVSVYNFKEKSGLTLRVHQMKIHDSESSYYFDD
jgi:hypothetical protein